MNNNRSLVLLMVLTLIVTIIGGTIAYWNWQSTSGQRTNVTFTVASGFTCGADGGGDITSSQKQLAPAACTNPEYAIQRTVTVSTTQDAGKEIVLDMWLKVNSIGSGLSNSNNFKYALTTTQLTSDSQCSDASMATLKTGGTVVEYGTFHGANTTDNSEFKLIDGKTYTQSTNPSETYYLYIWLDSAEESTATQNQTFSMTIQGTCTDELPVSNDLYTYTVNIYDSNNEAGTLTWIGQAIPANVANNYQFGTPSEAMASWENTSLGVSSPYYLKHKVENGVITESYVEFVIDTTLKTQLTAGCNGDTACETKIASLNTGTFTLRGLDTFDTTNGQCKAQYDDGNGNCVSPYYLDNAKEIYRAFGTNCDSNPNDVNFSSSRFGCLVAGLSAGADGNGGVNVGDDSTSNCYVYYAGRSGCYVW